MPDANRRTHTRRNELIRSKTHGRKVESGQEFAQGGQAHPIELLEASLNPSRDPERLLEGKADPSEGYRR